MTFKVLSNPRFHNSMFGCLFYSEGVNDWQKQRLSSKRNLNINFLLLQIFNLQLLKKKKRKKGEGGGRGERGGGREVHRQEVSSSVLQTAAVFSAMPRHKSDIFLQISLRSMLANWHTLPQTHLHTNDTIWIPGTDSHYLLCCISGLPHFITLFASVIGPTTWFKYLFVVQRNLP